ncbi:MAG: proton-conducting transporter membrane subunit, partial [Limisphaerales bacterium]
MQRHKPGLGPESNQRQQKQNAGQSLCVNALLLGRETGSMDFNVWAQQGVHTQGLASVLFLLALVGFGTKAGFLPLHVWLP